MNTTDPTILAAFIAAGAALFVGMLSSILTVANQLLTHWQAQHRDKQQYYSTVYKELFAPAIPDVLLYIDMASQIFEPPPIERQIEVKDRAIDTISRHLVHASPKLIASFQNINAFAWRSERGMNPTTAELRFLHDFVEEYIEVIQKTSLFSSRRQRDEIGSIVYRLILYLLHSYEFMDIAYNHIEFSQSPSIKQYYGVRKAIKQYFDANAKASVRAERTADPYREAIEHKTDQKLIDAHNTAVETIYRQRSAEEGQAGKAMNKAIVSILIKDKYTRTKVHKRILDAERRRNEEHQQAIEDNQRYIEERQRLREGNDEALG